MFKDIITLDNDKQNKWQMEGLGERGRKTVLKNATQYFFLLVSPKILPGRNFRIPLARRQTAKHREAPPLSPGRRRASRASANRKSCSPSAPGVSDLALPRRLAPFTTVFRPSSRPRRPYFPGRRRLDVLSLLAVAALLSGRGVEWVAAASGLG